MAYPILMPKAGQSMTEGTIVTWFKKEGDAVQRGEPLLEIETDKANLDCEAPEDGVLHAIFHQEGEVVPVLTVIGVVGAPGEEIDLEAIRSQDAREAGAGGESVPRREGSTPPPPARPDPPPARRDARPEESPARTATTPRAAGAKRAPPAAPRAPVEAPRTPPAARPHRAPRESDPRRAAASPLARRIADEQGVDLAALRGSGPGGRILRRDVESAPRSNGRPPLAGFPSAKPYPPPSPAPPPAVPIEGMRAAIASALQQSKATAPHFYTTAAVDVTPALGLKDRLERSGLELTVNDLILRAVALALVDEPRVNCRVFDDRIEYPGEVHLGVAVGTDDGLLVPVILSAQQFDLAGLAQASRDVIQRARSGKLVGTGRGTFTVSNLGMFGVESFSAIINPPEGAILAAGGIREELVPYAGGFVPRSILRLTLSCDHRAIDGLLAARFLSRVRYFLETATLE